jgi:hypothetical protein
LGITSPGIRAPYQSRATFNNKSWAAVVNLAFPTLPVKVDYLRERLGDEPVAVEKHELHGGYDRIIAAHPGVYYFLTVDLTIEARTIAITRSTIDKVPAHSILLWDSIYTTQNASLEDTGTLEANRKAGWMPLPELSARLNQLPEPRGEWMIFRSPP